MDRNEKNPKQAPPTESIWLRRACTTVISWRPFSDIGGSGQWGMGDKRSWILVTYDHPSGRHRRISSFPIEKRTAANKQTKRRKEKTNGKKGASFDLLGGQ